MNEDEAKIYRYDENISFRQCDLATNPNSITYGDCTHFDTREENWKSYYYCNQYGIHFHCTKHPAIELESNQKEFGTPSLKCSQCDNNIEISNFNLLLQNCLKILNIPKFKNAKLIRLDDWYTPEVKEKINVETDYWIEVDVKTDKDKDTIIILYVGKKGSKEKSQLFIKPEKLQLSSDYKDLDPATILSKIEVTLKDRILKQEYEKE